MTESPLNAALRQFEAVEANLLKAERVLAEIVAAIPKGIVFGVNPDYESNCHSFESLAASLPAIDGWKPEFIVMELDAIAQNRLDANELGEIEILVSVEREIDEPSRLLREYRHRFNQKRRQLIRASLNERIDAVDGCLRNLSTLVDETVSHQKITHPEFEQIRDEISQINVLLGSSVAKPARWGDLTRHLHFGMVGDLHDIIIQDWPSVKGGLRKSMYGEKEPIPIEVEDLGMLVSQKPSGPVATKLKWEILTEEDFERLIFALISSESGYENPEWLMKTNAPDRGRDLSAYRVHADSLAGTVRQRVIVQCKHWLSKSVGASEIATLREQMKLWEPPRVDVHVIATSGRFTSDAVAIVEKQNQSDSALRVEMWPESHLERLLASRPAIIAEFGLR